MNIIKCDNCLQEIGKNSHKYLHLKQTNIRNEVIGSFDFCCYACLINKTAKAAEIMQAGTQFVDFDLITLNKIGRIHND